MNEKKTSAAIETLVAINEITVGERFRKKFINIESLAESIKEIGLQNPIILDENKELVSGGRRLEAYKLLKEDFILARILNLKKSIYTEVDENNQRESFTISEKIAIADSIAEVLKEKFGERRGKKAQQAINEEDTNPEKSPAQGEETREFVARKAGFGNSYTLRQAKAVLEKAIPEVVEAMDAGIISINFANKVSQAPKKKQLTLLNEAKSDPETEGSKLDATNTERRKAKRALKSKKPTNADADPNFSVVRIAPDWHNEIFSDIAETPVKDYLNWTCGVLCIECPNAFLDSAIVLLSKWDLHFKAVITVYCKKGPEDVSLDYINKPVMHLVIGQIDPEVGPPSDWVDPVFDRQNIEDGLSEVIDKIWSDKTMTRIDMTSIEPRNGWTVWKIDYAKEGDE